MWNSRTLAVAGLAAALAMPAAAQRRGSDRDGPELGVARISVADGDVRVRTADGDEAQARGGDALRPGDALITGARARAEVELDRGNFARLSAESEMRVLDLGNLAYRLQLVRGLASLTQFKRYDADLDVETEQATIRVVKPAEFTVEARDGGQTDVTVRKGQVDVVAGSGTQRLKKGLVSVRGEGRDAQIRTAKAEPKSEFDEWAKRRDGMLDNGPTRGASIYPPYWSAGLGMGWGGWGAWGYPYHPYYSFGPGLRTMIVSPPRGSYHGSHRGHGRGRR